MERLASRVHLKRAGVTGPLVLIGLVAGLLGLAAGGRPQAAIGASLLAAVILDAVAARYAVAPVTISLHGPPEAVAGQESEWVVQATGLRRPVVLTPAVVPRTPRYILRSGEPLLITLPPFPRGLVSVVSIDLTASGPLGLFQAGRRVMVQLASPLAVGPMPQPIQLEWPRPRAVGFGLTHGAPLGDDLFRSIRDYRRGDERRRIHWGSTAHHGHLMVRENDGTGVVAVRIVVDPGQTGPEADHVTGIATTVAIDAMSKGWLVQMVTADATVVPYQPGRPGSPFSGPFPTVPLLSNGSTTRAERVTSARAVNRQLATAVQGPMVLPRWPGMTCAVGPLGVRWE